jgi:hypothetical protein
MFKHNCDIMKLMKKKSSILFDFKQKGSSQHFRKYEVLPGDFLVFYGCDFDENGPIGFPVHFYSIVISVVVIEQLDDDSDTIRAIVTLFNLESNKFERVFPSEEYRECQNEPAGFSGIELDIKSVIRV